MLEVLQVEDSQDDVDLFQLAIREIGARAQVRVFPDGAQAIDYLTSSGPDASGHQPDLILLDLNLPKMPGLEVMSRLKQDPRFKHIPIVVFTISNSPDDIQRAYLLGASCYLVKPVDFPELVELTRRMLTFWRDVRYVPSS